MSNAAELYIACPVLVVGTTVYHVGMNITQLTTFVAVIETGSLTSAARRTGVTQPGVTRQMQRLEAELGVALLERLPTGVRSSPEGERFLAFARETLEA